MSARLQRRVADKTAVGAKTVWQLAYNGSVGSQVLLGIPARIYRSTHILATLKRDEMLREGRDGEMEKTIQAARELQASLRKQASE